MKIIIDNKNKSYLKIEDFRCDKKTANSKARFLGRFSITEYHKNKQVNYYEEQYAKVKNGVWNNILEYDKKGWKSSKSIFLKINKERSL